MKKKTAILALLLAGVMSFGVMATAGCKKKGPSGDDTNINNPGGDNPGGDNPGGDNPGGDNPGGNNPGGDNPGGNNPGGDNPGGDEEQQPVILSEDTAVSLTAGETKTLSAAEGTTFTSEHPTVATVDSNGVISAKNKGVAKVKATNGNTVITCTVIVLDKLSGSSQAVSKDPFTFNKTIDIGSVTSTTTPEVSDPNAAEYKVEFSDGAVTQNVANGCQAVEPLVENDGHYLTGWKSAGEAYDFSEPVSSNLALAAQWASLPSGVSLLQGNSESIAVEFSGSASSSTVSYRLHGGSDSWHQIDSELIRAKDGGVRADIVGIKAGVYDVKVNSTEITGGVPVKAYDRSGYAHFKYTSGVGAYKDDGTIKNNTLVIYLTEANKNDILDYCYVNGVKVDISQYMRGADGTQYKGIGELLNNRRYSGNDRSGVGIAKLTHVYDAVAVRFIGTVENYVDRDKPICSITGLTDYNSTGNGGSAGDNGGMARMVNAKNLTIEGIGDDAQIKGWGVHFIASGLARTGNDDGKSFEVRNITFNQYPEDAVGMEGEQESGKITNSVERCWIHDNTFLPGYSKTPTDSDKGEGDGSCDFKRGQYLTCSYNYYEFCHKTNLIGSADSSLQFNLTYHHNMWYQCESRIPLIRQANVHFYNNYVFGDAVMASKKQGSLSYVHSLRANCYLFTEGNYYDGCKNITSGTGGVAKAYNNTYYACGNGGTGSLVLVDKREQEVSNKCAYQSTSYSTFDTDPNLFYYDATNKKTDALLDDSVGARVRCVLYAGAQGHSEVTAKMQEMNTNAPTNNPTVPDKGKGRGQVITFSVAANTTLTINATTSTSGAEPQVIRNDGKMVVAPFTGEKTVILDAGIYMLCSGQKDKDINVSSISLQVDNAEAKKARVAEAKKAIEAIPNPVTRNSGSAIQKAIQAYANLLTEEEKTELGGELKERLTKAQAAYETVLVECAIARIEYIGEVTEYSGADITAAVTAYNAVGAAAQSKVTNHSKLTAAQDKFAEYALTNLQNEINRLPLSTDLGIVDSRVAVELAISLYQEQLNDYSALETEDKAKITVTNVNASLTVLNAKLAEIAAAEQEAENLAKFNELLAATTVENVTLATGGSLKSAYESLTQAQKDGVSADDKTKYDAIIAKYNELGAQTVVAIFARDDKNKPLTDLVPENVTVNGSYHDKATFEYDGKTYNDPLKMESGTVVTIVITERKALTVQFAAESTFELDEAETLVKTDSKGSYTVVIEAGTHKIKKGNKGTKNDLLWIVLGPAE